jgi:hypothetical protein
MPRHATPRHATPRQSRLPAMEGRAPSVLNNTKTNLRNVLKEI